MTQGIEGGRPLEDGGLLRLALGRTGCISLNLGLVGVTACH